MKRNIVLTFLLPLLFLSCVHTSKSGLSGKISVNLKEENNKLIIDFYNKTNKEISIPIYYLFDDDMLYNNYFIVMDSKDNKAEYSGIIADFWIIDYKSLPKHEKITNEINLQDFYEIKPNENYKVQYSFSGLKSNTIDFILHEN